MKKLLMAAALTLAVTPAFAWPPVQKTDAYFSGEKLFSACMDKTEAGQGVCLGYIIGVADLMSGLTSKGITYNGYSACVGADVKSFTLRGVVTVFLAQHAKDRAKLTASSLVAAALDDAFPCGDG